MTRDGQPVLDTSDTYPFAFGRSATDRMIEKKDQLKRVLRDKSGRDAYIEVTHFWDFLKQACSENGFSVSGLDQFLKAVTDPIDRVLTQFTTLTQCAVSVDEELDRVGTLIQTCYRANRLRIGHYVLADKLLPNACSVLLRPGDQIWGLSPIGMDLLLTHGVNSTHTPIVQLSCLDAVTKMVPAPVPNLVPQPLDLGNDRGSNPIYPQS